MSQRSRTESLHRAAELRRAIITFVNEATTPVSRADMATALQPLIDTLGYRTDNVDNFVFTLSQKGEILHIPNPSGRAYLYVSTGSGQISPTPSARMVARKTPTPNPLTKRHHNSGYPLSESQPATPSSPSPPPLKIDLIQSTGRLRIAFQGVEIEIGLAE